MTRSPYRSVGITRESIVDTSYAGTRLLLAMNYLAFLHLSIISLWKCTDSGIT